MEAKKTTSSSRKPTGFLDLPVEIRLQVYRSCLVREYPVDVIGYISIDRRVFPRLPVRDKNKSLLLVSKKIGLEALDVLYGENEFMVHLHDFREGGPSDLREHFTEANIRMMRKLQVFMRIRGASYGRDLDSTIWSPILANLRTLSIVAQQPSAPHGMAISEQRMGGWIIWLKGVLQYVAGQLSSSCAVEVDDNGGRQTSAVMRHCFPRGYKKVQTLLGDRVFMRPQRYEQ